MTNELVVKENYALLSANETAREALAANLGGGKLNRMDLDRVGVPAGGSTMWSIPTLEGEESAKELKGIILAFRDGRTYWRKRMGDGEQTPPDCYSEDGVNGTGSPGAACAGCPMNQFGTANEGAGKGKACKEKRLLLMVRAGDVLPFVVNVPTTSLYGKSTTTCRKYFMRLSSKAVPFYDVESVLTLEKDKSVDGISFSRIAFNAARQLDEASRESVRLWRAKLVGALDGVSVKDSVDKPAASE